MTGRRTIRVVIVQTELRVCGEGGYRPLVLCLKLWLHEARRVLDNGRLVHTVSQFKEHIRQTLQASESKQLAHSCYITVVVWPIQPEL
jgi:hypothetical protein